MKFVDAKFKKIKFLKKIEKNKKKNYYSFGNKYKKKIFYIIHRSPGAGFFSNLVFVLNKLKFCKEKKFIPIVDMKNFPTLYNNYYKNYNVWEKFFKSINKFKLKDIYRSQKVIIDDIGIPRNNLYLTGKAFIKFKKIIIPQLKFIEKAKIFYKKNFNKNDKVLGIHFRGTDYKTAAGHPFPPTKKIMFKFTKEILDKYGYNKIFLVTEEIDYQEFFKKNFKKECFFYNSYRFHSNREYYFSQRKNHDFLLGEEILVETLILSMCDGLIDVETNVISAAKFFKKKKIKFHKLYLGDNSKNKYIARFKWYLKKILPENFGGFKVEQFSKKN
tara:strand:+ start:310 stop:1296 length:987 start_codon:yes stop_codon:yes gene_type:complete